jgi:hypothetical protein
VSILLDHPDSSDAPGWESFFAAASVRAHLRKVALFAINWKRAPSTVLIAVLSLPHIESLSIMKAMGEELIAIGKSTLRELTVHPTNDGVHPYASIAPLFASTLCTTLTRLTSATRYFVIDTPPLRSCLELRIIDLTIFDGDDDAASRGRCLTEMALLPQLTSVTLRSYTHTDTHGAAISLFVNQLIDDCRHVTSLHVRFH